MVFFCYNSNIFKIKYTRLDLIALICFGLTDVDKLGFLHIHSITEIQETAQPVNRAKEQHFGRNVEITIFNIFSTFFQNKNLLFRANIKN